MFTLFFDAFAVSIVLALVGHPGLKDALTGIIRFIGIVLIVLGVIGYYYWHQAVIHVDCVFGSQDACGRLVEYVPDNVPKWMVDKWNENIGNHKYGVAFSAWHRNPRWSLSKTIWYDGENVKIHRDCVADDYPKYDGWEANTVCLDAQIISGKHAGETLPRDWNAAFSISANVVSKYDISYNPSYIDNYSETWDGVTVPPK